MKQLDKLYHIVHFYFYFSLTKLSGKLLPLFRQKRKKKPAHILFLAAFFPENAGYEYRTRKWAEILSQHGYRITIKTVFDKEEFQFLLHHRFSRFQRKFLRIRFQQCIQLRKYDVVIVRRTLLMFNEYGNLFMEKFLQKVHPHIILDYDDDLQLAVSGKTKNLFGSLMLENRNKFYESLSLYKKFLPGSGYLKELAKIHQPDLSDDHIFVLPTCVDYDKYLAKEYTFSDERIHFGWIGSVGNLKYLNMLIQPLNNVNREFPIDLIVISGREYAPDNAGFPIINIPWSLETEIESLYKIDIGLMPLKDKNMEKGKCGFKLIQYMGLGIFSIATSVTANIEIIDDTLNGFLIKHENNWEDTFRKVLQQKNHFTEWGNAARKKILEKYTFQSNTKKLIKFIDI